MGRDTGVKGVAGGGGWESGSALLSGVQLSPPLSSGPKGEVDGFSTCGPGQEKRTGLSVFSIQESKELGIILLAEASFTRTSVKCGVRGERPFLSPP